MWNILFLQMKEELRTIPSGGRWQKQDLRSRVYDPPPCTAHPCPCRWSLGPAALASHHTPHSTAGTWGTSSQDPLCSQAGMPGNEALGPRPNAQLHSSRDLCGLYCPLFPNYFCPSGLDGAKQSHNVFLMQWCFFPAGEVYRRVAIQSWQCSP